tara:strand:- start:29591 stop:29932 length:342 start_codon:yes stop_codon:yes gene_type:complete
MREVIYRDHSFTETVTSQDGKLYVNKIFHNKKALEQNKMIRHRQLMHKGQLGLHDKADIRMGLSIPSTIEWNMFKKAHPDIYKDLKSVHEQDRMSACQRIAMLEPEWVVQQRL